MGGTAVSGREFWKGETAGIVKAMKASGNREGVIANWKEGLRLWAEANPNNPDAAAALAWLPHWRVRPFYSADELAPLWPALAIAIGHTVKWPAVLKSAKRLEFELDYAGLPSRFMLGRKYYIVERIHYWTDASHEEIEREFDAQR
ncbi:MAG: hypothetical protein C0510_06795 [Erythrobacter sp.]|nr:hypothetical protein [Erythrobacter sp.]